MKKYDVAVIGGGFAGAAAAFAAAREGASVIIVDKSNCLGGAAVNALVHPFMRFSAKIDGKEVDLSAGLFTDILQGLAKSGSADRHKFLEEELKFLLNDMAEEYGVDLLFHSYLFKTNVTNGRIDSVSLATRAGVIDLEADLFIDATGDAQLAYLAGCPTVLGRDPDRLCQPMTLCFRLGNVDVERFWKSRPELARAHAESLAAGELINPRENILVFKTPVPNVLHFNTTRVVKKDPTDPVDLTRAEIIARKQVREIYEFMKKHADGLENSFLMMTAPEIGVRESRMIVGEYLLTEKDCLATTKFEDAIAACNYAIDIHNPEGTGTSIYNFEEGTYYTIPYRCLIPKGVSNVLVAGRCISSDHGAQASYRIMPTVCSIGEAAGVAAGIAVKDGVSVREISVKKLQDTLKANNAFIGI
ncbi:MAG: FAD-dependent oxidoreductase [Clostridia bacterium]|nr:FAD-dependent oxidoreductase [Clostridia bacterium]